MQECSTAASAVDPGRTAKPAAGVIDTVGAIEKGARSIADCAVGHSTELPVEQSVAIPNLAPQSRIMHQTPEAAKQNSSGDASAPRALYPTVGEVFGQIFRHPIEIAIRRWNWKAALFSSVFRANIFFFANLSAGLDAALGAMGAEFLYRGLTAGVYGALMQAFRTATPRWATTFIVMFGIPAISHAVEFLVHWLRGTPNLGTSIIASFTFTALTTLYNLHMMRRGILVVGRAGGDSLWEDIKQFPSITVSFITSGFGFADRKSTQRPEDPPSKR